MIKQSTPEEAPEPLSISIDWTQLEDISEPILEDSSISSPIEC
jgi:hypothetical protein